MRISRQERTRVLTLVGLLALTLVVGALLVTRYGGVAPTFVAIATSR